MQSNLPLRRKAYCGTMNFMMLLCTGITVALTFFLIIYIAVESIPHFSVKILTTKPSYLEDSIGVLPDILNTVYIIITTLVFVLPLGIGAAIYLNEYAKPGKLVRIIEFTTETLSGIPSIIFGMFGMVFFGTTLGLGYSILTGALTLTLLILPLITRNTQEALRTVPDSYRSGALGIGATKWYMIRTILLPSAMPGIITGVILAIGRIVGESAALIFTAGSGYFLPKSIGGAFSKILESGGTLTIEMYLRMTNAEYDAAFGIAVVLLVIVLFINALTKFLTKRFDVTRLDERRKKKSK